MTAVFHQLVKKCGCVGGSYLSIQHVHTEVAESCLKEIVLCAVFQQRAVHCMCCNLEAHQHTKKQLHI